MTVAAIVVSDGAAAALMDAAGRAAIRRIVDVAWAGGALPIVVVADDADGATSAVLSGSPALLVASAQGGEAADYLVGSLAAAGAVQDTSACLFWPGRMVWVDPETVTSLIEAHGHDLGRPVRPTFEGSPGWPVLLPIERVAGLGDAERSDLATLVAAFEAEMISIELGDPGAVHGHELAIDELPAFSGPSQPVGGPPPEWGAAAADIAEPETTD